MRQTGILYFFLVSGLFAENINVKIADIIEVSKDKTQSNAVQLTHDSAAIISLDKDTRFLRGIELTLSAPQTWLNHPDSLAIVIYSNVGKIPAKGTAARMEATQLKTETLANKIQTIYQVPLTKNHNMRSTPYVTVISSNALSALSFPLLYRIMPIVPQVDEEIEDMRFQLTVKPLINDEGAVKINVKHPIAQNKAAYKPYTTLIDDRVIENIEEEQIIKEGEHYLMIISNDYRNESRRFILERGKTMEINITLQDITPLILFETPDNAKIFLDNVRISPTVTPRPIEPGPHEVKIQVSDYTIIKTIFVRKGKTYRVAFMVDLDVTEDD
jgi:hypothetical protein